MRGDKLGKDTNDDFNIDDDYKQDNDNDKSNDDNTDRKENNIIIEEIIEQYRAKDGQICDLILDVSKDTLSDKDCRDIVNKISDLKNEYRFNYAIIYSIIHTIYKYTSLEVLEIIKVNCDHLEAIIKDDVIYKKHKKFIQYLEMEI